VKENQERTNIELGQVKEITHEELKEIKGITD